MINPYWNHFQHIVWIFFRFISCSTPNPLCVCLFCCFSFAPTFHLSFHPWIHTRQATWNLDRGRFSHSWCVYVRARVFVLTFIWSEATSSRRRREMMHYVVVWRRRSCWWISIFNVCCALLCAVQKLEKRENNFPNDFHSSELFFLSLHFTERSFVCDMKLKVNYLQLVSHQPTG